MSPSEDCVELAKRLEGFRSMPYLCPGGRWTIGYGSTRHANGADVGPSSPPISESDADMLLRAQLAGACDQVSALASLPLNQGQIDALTLFVSNVGVRAFSRSTLLRKLNSGDYAGAAEEFPKWDKITDAATGQKRSSRGLSGRRKLERRIFEKGCLV